MAARPLVLPEPFTGESSWDQWIAHFKNVAAVNGWDDAAKLPWLRARLTRRAQTAYQKFTQEDKARYEESKRLCKRDSNLNAKRIVPDRIPDSKEAEDRRLGRLC